MEDNAMSCRLKKFDNAICITVIILAIGHVV